MEQWRVLTRERGVSIVVLDMPLLDTRCQRDLTGTLIADIVLNLLSYVAQTEREMIRRRQAEGIAAARARGVRFGRCEKPLPDGFAEVVGLWRARRISCEEALRMIRDGECGAFNPKLLEAFFAVEPALRELYHMP